MVGACAREEELRLAMSVVGSDVRVVIACEEACAQEEELGLVMSVGSDLPGDCAGFLVPFKIQPKFANGTEVESLVRHGRCAHDNK